METFDISKTVVRERPSPTNDYSNDQRSMRSEYNYDKKKKFVELLNKPIKSSFNGGAGLAAIHLGQ